MIQKLSVKFIKIKTITIVWANKISHLIKYPYNKISHWHNLIMQMDARTLKEVTPVNPYNVFLNWLVDTMIIGLAATAFLALIGWSPNHFTPVLAGISVWLFIEIIKRMFEAMK